MNDDSSSPSVNAINDPIFYNHLLRLKNLRNFLYQEAIPFDSSEGLSFEIGDLNTLFFQENGRPPSPSEWSQLERQTQQTFLLLTPALRRRFLMGRTPWIIAWLPAYFLCLAAGSLVFTVVTIKNEWPLAWALFEYLIWLASLGATGALAFIGMNALSVQDDITFDLNSTRLIMLRVVLGALFAVVLTLPFGYADFLAFCAHVANPYKSTTGPEAIALTKQAALLLLPFVLGFSTSLVILILNQIIEAIQVFFGRKTPAS